MRCPPAKHAGPPTALAHPLPPHPRRAACCESDLCNTLNHTAVAATSAGLLSVVESSRKTCDVVYAVASTATYADFAATSA